MKVNVSRIIQRIKGAVLAAVVVGLVTLLGQKLHPFLANNDIVMLYLVGAVVIAARIGIWPALIYSAGAVSCFNYFFIEPLFSFDVSNASYWLTFGVMFFACFVISAQAAQLREKIFLSQEKEEQTKKLSEMKIRNLLLSAIPHDLRTPLASIIGASDALTQSEGLHSETDRKLAASIHAEAQRFSKVINNLLSIARMEEGQLSLNKSIYDLEELIGIAISNSKAAIENHDLSVNVEHPLPFLKVDGLLISQLFQNLLENAGRHTQPGSKIKIVAYKKGDALVVSFLDNGKGIDADLEKGLFNMKGTGLGLSISQAIATAHDITIKAENIHDGGARFSLTIPASVMVSDEELTI